MKISKSSAQSLIEWTCYKHHDHSGRLKAVDYLHRWKSSTITKMAHTNPDLEMREYEWLDNEVLQEGLDFDTHRTSLIGIKILFDRKDDQVCKENQ